MSWWVYLRDHAAKPTCDFGADSPHACPVPCYPPVDVERHAEGGTYALGGTSDAELNVTYNYGGHFTRALGGGFKDVLDDKRAGDVIPLLEGAVAMLGTERDGDYWNNTPGNAGHALSILLAWARQRPDAIFAVS